VAKSLEILAYEETPLGVLCLRRRELVSSPGTMVTEITLNHEFLMSSYLTDSERALSDIAVQMHGGNQLDVLVGGLGLGYTARQALSWKEVCSVEVVEFLPQVIAWLGEGLVPLSAELNDDSRLTIVNGDVYARLSGAPTNKFDLILIDVDHSPDDRLDTGPGFFYTRQGLELAREHLNPGGVLGVWSYAGSSPFADALKDVFGEVRVEPVTALNTLIDEEQTDWLFFVRTV